MKKNIKKAYLSILIIVLPVMLGVLSYKKCNGKPAKQLPISYDRKYVEPLDNLKNYEESISFKGHGMVLKRVEKLEDGLAEIYNLTGENGIGWNKDPGDFRRVEIKLGRKRTVQFDNDNGGWLDIFKKEDYSSGSIADFLKTPEQSKKIKKHPYGITLDMGEGDQILMLFGYQYSTDPARLLTLIYIGKERAEMIFNKHFNIFEIREQQQGYSLIGRMNSLANEIIQADPYEISIRDGKLTFEKLPLQKVYEGQDPSITLYNAKGWSLNEQPGDFTRLEITAPPPPKSRNPENQVFDVAYYNDVWIPFPAAVKIPTNTTTIKQTPYFIILENTVGRIILLNERDHRNSRAGCLTILRSAPSYPTSLFNGYFRLQEITEDERAYYLLGTSETAGDANKICEIMINKAAMSKVACNW